MRICGISLRVMWALWWAAIAAVLNLVVFAETARAEPAGEVSPPLTTARRSAMGADLTGEGGWTGGALGADGRIYAIPGSAGDILIIDPAARTATRRTMGLKSERWERWSDPVLGPDGRIYGMPFGAGSILIIDPAAGRATRSAMGAVLRGSDEWGGGVLGPDGRIYGIPSSGEDILIIDPVAGAANRDAMWADLVGNGKWSGGVLGADGRIYGIPGYAEDILIIDPAAGRATRSAMGADLSDKDRWTFDQLFKWSGGVLGLDGRIYGIPYQATDILIIDPAAGKATRSTMGADLSEMDRVTGGPIEKWSSGVLGPDGRIYGIPFGAKDILIIDPAAGTATRSAMGADLSDMDRGLGVPVFKWSSGVLGPGGRIYGIPGSARDILIIE